MTETIWTEEDSFQARLAHVMESDDYAATGCHRTPDCPCPPCERDRRPTRPHHRVEWTGRLLVHHESPQCACETTGRLAATCPWHGPEDTEAPQIPKGWE